MGNDLRVMLDDLKLSYDYLYKQQLFMSKKKRKEVKSEKRSEIAFGRENNNKKNRSIRRFVYICG